MAWQSHLGSRVSPVFIVNSVGKVVWPGSTGCFDWGLRKPVKHMQYSDGTMYAHAYKFTVIKSIRKNNIPIYVKTSRLHVLQVEVKVI